MKKRSYQQNCALALALDVIGERWSLLLVRELLTGPKRYNELLASLSGIGTNLLAARLKELEAKGVIRLCETKSGTTYKSYELTEAGEQLEESVLALVKWGNQFRNSAKSDYLSQPHWLMVALKAAFRPEKANNIETIFEIESDEFIFNVEIKDNQLIAVPGTVEDAAFRLSVDGRALSDIASKKLDWNKALTTKKAKLNKNKSAFTRIFKTFEM